MIQLCHTTTLLNQNAIITDFHVVERQMMNFYLEDMLPKCAESVDTIQDID